MTKRTKTFEMNGRAYSCEPGALEALRSIAPDARKTGDNSAVAALMALGLKTGAIKELGAA